SARDRRSGFRSKSRARAARFPPSAHDGRTTRSRSPGSGGCSFRHRRSGDLPSDLRGEFDGELAAALGTGYEDAATVRLHDVLDDRESEARRSGFEAVNAPLRIALEDPVADLGRDSRSGVGNFQLHIIFAAAGGDLYLAACRRVTQRVAEQVGNHPPEL